MSQPPPFPVHSTAISEPSDRQLLTDFLRSRSADLPLAESAMRMLVERHSSIVLGVCRRALGDHTDAEDAAQAVFLVLWKKAETLKEPSIGGWLHRTALLVCRNAIRARGIRQTHELRAAEMKAIATPAATDWSAVREVLDAELDRLPEKYRVPLILFHLEGLSLTEIAERMSVAGSTVGTWLGRAREQLAARLTRREITVGAAVLATGLSSVAEAGGVPTAFAGSTVTAASLYGAGHLSVAGGLSSSTSALAGKCLSATLFTPLRVAITGLLGCAGVGALVVGLFLGSREGKTPPPPPSLPSLPQLLPTLHAKNPLSNDEEPAGTPAPILEESDPQFGGITGQIIINGPPQPQSFYDSQLKTNVLDQSLYVDSQTGGIANVFVFLKKAPAHMPPELQAVPNRKLIVDNIGAVFAPHAFVARAGQPIVFRNGSPFSINVHSNPTANLATNFILKPMDRIGTTVTFPLQEAVPFRVNDDLHATSSCYALVLDHPYAAVTNPQGQFHIPRLPVGTHSFRVWHERTGFIQRDYQVTVIGGQSIALPPLVVPAEKLQSR